MLYLNSIENAEASPTEEKYAICHEKVPSMPNIPELAPSQVLLTQWQSNEIDWEEFREQFTDEMRAEYRKEESRLKGLIKYSLENDVTLHSPEPSGEQTYRAILEGIINIIWKSQGQTGHVINLAPEPVGESQLTEVETIPQEDEQNSEPQEGFALFISELSEANEGIKSLQEMIAAKDDEIRLIKENAELKTRIDQLEGQINTHTESIKLLDESISNKDGEIKLLTDSTRKRGKLNAELKTQIAQLQDINTHPRIRDIAVKATEDDSVFGEHFRTLNIDENRPEILLETLRNWLIVRLKTGPNDLRPLPELIQEHFDQAGDRADRDLAHVIRTQRNLIVFKKQEVDERTIMGRALCCFFAAALLCPELPELE